MSHILTTIRLTPEASHDVKTVHDTVLHATLTGEPPRRVLWAQPRPRILVIRHDRAVTTHDLPTGWADNITHTPYWHPTHRVLAAAGRP